MFNTFLESVFKKPDYQRKIDDTKLVRIDRILFSRGVIETALQAQNFAKAKRPDGLGNLPLKSLATSMSKSLELDLKLLVINTSLRCTGKKDQLIFCSTMKTSSQ